ncbi:MULTISPECIES: large-conductance mechanosensitive channel protein MscL [Fructilactobacillus]|uniref:Large-conductance mechanosensitive channel n=2 Tax=Fructilactobacillus TaxID=2767881 RepID=A0A9Q8ZQT2_9LACO|nr:MULTISPECIES: large-conductance mechanosensitive channel protein MscL [Fructilactobacillus]USS87074.1 large-conductance mechanosensitive channel protein MscL [Fructilactobacillus cliffordii]USS88797.1 large-conductance mechanosensitive channel protein MscL [Fructilactobacillus cliffordii]USS90176.1 large-conductance mechanosensitive channel protein MscL [Fructilactobacillus carniphilus]
MIKEFKAFISKGNVIDMAVGVIIGSAFTGIVSSLVKNILNPLIGLFIGNIDLSSLSFKVGGATFRYGVFLNAVINFFIIAFVVFIIVKILGKMRLRQDKEKTTPKSEQYLAEIVTLLKQEQGQSEASQETKETK